MESHHLSLGDATTRLTPPEPPQRTGDIVVPPSPSPAANWRWEETIHLVHGRVDGDSFPTAPCVLLPTCIHPTSWVLITQLFRGASLMSNSLVVHEHTRKLFSRWEAPGVSLS